MRTFYVRSIDVVSMPSKVFLRYALSIAIRIHKACTYRSNNQQPSHHLLIEFHHCLPIDDIEIPPLG